MKNKFPGHFLSDDAKEKIWKEGIFVFDANILLDMYRYSEETKESLLLAIESIRERAWLPHRAAKEYLDNRIKVILDQGTEYETAISEIEKLKRKLDNKRSHPFISAKTMSQVDTALELATKELEENKKTHNSRITNDEIRDRIAAIFEEAVGEEATKEEIQKTIIEGKTRYENKIPPGYLDSKKQNEESTDTGIERAYGDLIIWKSIIEKALSEESSVIFITGDKKEDWWLKANGKTISPRPELVKEFEDKTGQKFYMYAPESFIQRTLTSKKDRPSQEIIDEIINARKNKEVQNFEEHKLTVQKISYEEHLQNQENVKKQLGQRPRLRDLNTRLYDTNSEIQATESALTALEANLGFLENLNQKNDDSIQNILELKQEIEQLSAQQEQLMQKKASLIHQKWLIMNNKN